MVKKTLIVGFLIFALVFCMFSAVVSASGSWSLTGQTGTWDKTAPDDFAKYNGWSDGTSAHETQGRLNFTLGTISDFSGFNMNFSYSNFTAIRRGFFDFQGILDVYVAFQFVRSDGAYVWSWNHLKAVQGIYGNGWTENHYGWGEPYSSSSTVDRAFSNFGVVIQTDASSTTVQYETWVQIPSDVTSDMAVYFGRNDTSNVVLYRQDVTVNMFVLWSGSGTFEFTSGSNGVYTGGSQPSNVNGGTQTGGLFGQIAGYFSIFTSLFSALIGIAMILVTNAPIILLAVVLGMGFACLTTMSIDPLRKFAEMIWSLANSTMHTITGIVQTVKDLIQWW